MLAAISLILVSLPPSTSFLPPPLVPSFPSSTTASSTFLLFLPPSPPPPSSVTSKIDSLYPPSSVEHRNSLSRTDGYWPYVRTNKPPPLEYTYGEFPLSSFDALLTLALSVSGVSEASEVDFLDLGSGAGRLVLAAKLLKGFRSCEGVEMLPTLHRHAEEVLGGEGGVRLFEGSWSDPWLYLGRYGVIFVYSSCLDAPKLSELSSAIERSCRPGAVIISTEHRIPGDFISVREAVDVPNDLVGGTSTCYVQVVEESKWREGLEAEMASKRPTDEEMQARKAVAAVEEGGGGWLFKVQWENTCKGLGVPESIWGGGL